MALITCPKCGKQFSEHAVACPQCGISQEEVQRLIAEKKAQEAAERERLRKEREAREAEEERLRKEREAKEAEEARLRAEKRAEWWKQNGKKVRNASLISITILLLVLISVEITHGITEKRAIAEANTIVEQADACIATFQFDEARNICENGLKTIDNEEARRIVFAKETDITAAKSKADTEYEEALRKLRILLDADDNVFNQYSNGYLDKMIKIYPNQKETIYYKSLRNKGNDENPTINPLEYEKAGDLLFAQAKYEQAHNKYYAAIIVIGETPFLKHRQANCSKCLSLLKTAQTAENEARYSEAAKYYSDLYDIHALPKYKSKSAALEQKAKQMLQVSNNIYDLVVGSYTDDAKDPLREIRAKGYRDAFLVAIVDDNGCPRNRVIAKRVYTKEEARNVQKALTNQGVKSWIWRH